MEISGTPSPDDTGLPPELDFTRPAPEPEWSSLLVRRHDVTHFWPLVKDGVEYVRGKTHPSWQAQDVYKYLIDGNAWLLITMKDERMAGFVILGPKDPCPFTGRRDMLLWIAYSKVKGTTEATMPRLVELARGAGFHALIYQSPRFGYLSRRTGSKKQLTGVAEKLGFEVREITYARPIRQRPESEVH